MKTNFNFTIGNATFTIDNTPVNLENITLNYEGDMNAQELTTSFGQLKDLFKMIKDASEPNRGKIINNNAKQENPKISVPLPTTEPNKPYGERFKRAVSILTNLGFERTKRNFFDYTIVEDEPVLIKAYVSSMGCISVTLETKYSTTDIFDVTEEEGRVDYAYDIPEDIPEEAKIKIDTILQRMKKIK